MSLIPTEGTILTRTWSIRSGDLTVGSQVNEGATVQINAGTGFRDGVVRVVFTCTDGMNQVDHDLDSLGDIPPPTGVRFSRCFPDILTVRWDAVEGARNYDLEVTDRADLDEEAPPTTGATRLTRYHYTRTIVSWGRRIYHR